MERIEKLFGKGKQVKIGDLEIEIKPLTVKDIDLVMDMTDEGKRTEATAKLIRLTLKEAIPEATEKQLDKVSFEHIKTLMNAIMEVNNLDKGTKTDLEKIKNVQERFKQHKK